MNQVPPTPTIPPFPPGIDIVIDNPIHNAMSAINTLREVITTTMNVYVNDTHVIESVWTGYELKQLKATLLDLTTCLVEELKVDLKDRYEDVA